MPINATEVGKTFRLGAGLDMSSSTALSLKFTHTDGTTFTVTNPAVTAPATPVTDPDIGALSASEYMEYVTDGTEFTKAGVWTVRGTYEDATPNKWFSVKASVTIGSAS